MNASDNSNPWQILAMVAYALGCLALLTLVYVAVAGLYYQQGLDDGRMQLWRQLNPRGG